MCRTVETAELAFGAAERAQAVRDAGPAPAGSPDRFAALRTLLSTAPPAGVNTVLVGHAYPIYTLIGGQYLEEGEAAVIWPGVSPSRSWRAWASRSGASWRRSSDHVPDPAGDARMISTSTPVS